MAARLSRLLMSFLALGLATLWTGLPARASESAPGAAVSGSETELRELNAAWIRSYAACDVARFRLILADDFQGVLADGRVIGKAEFLGQAAIPPEVQDLRLRSVSIRVFGEAAIVTGSVSYTRAGATVGTRYTAAYVRRDGRWRMESVQWTRISS